MRRRLLRITLALVTVAFAGCIYFLGTIDAHQANLRYILWKHHAWAFQSFMLPFLNVGDKFTIPHKEKKKKEIQPFFPLLPPQDRTTKDNKKSKKKEMIDHHPDYQSEEHTSELH